MQITVDDTLDGAALATVRIRDEGCVWSSGDKLKVGSELKIELGYVGQTSQVFIGDITGWKGGFPRRGPVTLTVIAQDRFHRLRRNRRQKTFLEMKDSDAISEVGSGVEGINSVDAAATPVTQNSILQWNQTDADFVLERAKLYDMEVFVDDKKLVVREPKLTEAPVATIAWHEELRTFRTAVTLNKQQKQLKVTAWDMMKKEALEAVVAEGDERDLMGGTQPGANSVADVDGEFKWYATTPASTPDEVEAYAKGLFHKRSQAYVVGEGTCVGDPLIQRGTVIELEGLGELLAGKYYCRRVIHTLTQGSGYTTTFRVYRTAVKAPAPPTTQEHEDQVELREQGEALLDPNWQGSGPMSAEVAASPHKVSTEVEGTVVQVEPGVKSQPTIVAPVMEAEPPTPEERVSLKLRFNDEDGDPFANAPYILKVGDETIEGTLDGDGRLSESVPKGHPKGQITIWEDPDKSGDSFEWPIRIKGQ
jgi:phage protein D